MDQEANMTKIIRLEVAFECPSPFNYDADAPRLRDFVASAIVRAMYANPSMDLKPGTVESRVLMVITDGTVERKRWS
jgi:hypothetical protein